MKKTYSMKRWGGCLAAALFILTACEQKSHSELPVLDMARELSTSETGDFIWNSVAKDALLKPLKTEHLIGNALGIADIWEDKVLMMDAQTNRVFVFDTEGKELHSFKHHGNGPGEYVYLTHVQFHRPDNTIFVHDNNGKILHYTFDGQCVKEEKADFYGNVALLKEDGKAYTINASGKVMVGEVTADYRADNGFLPYPSGMTKQQKIGNALLSSRNINADKLLYNPAYNDTLFSITDQGAVPFCVLGKGEHQPTMKELKNPVQLMRQKNDRIIRMHVGTFSSYLYLLYRCDNESVYDLWNLADNKLVAKSVSSGGFKYRLPSGNEVVLQPDYITEDYIAFIVYAEDCMDDIPGLKEDDNQVMLILKLK